MASTSSVLAAAKLPRLSSARPLSVRHWPSADFWVSGRAAIIAIARSASATAACGSSNMRVRTRPPSACRRNAASGEPFGLGISRLCFWEPQR